MLHALQALAHEHGKDQGGRAELPDITALAHARILVSEDSHAALQALDITLETVKWNLRHIFAKLGVSSRYDAIDQARNQKLID